MANIRQSADFRFFDKVNNFPRNLYKVDDRSSHLFKLLYSILEGGVSVAKGLQDIANQSQSSLALTSGGDLDQFFQIFGIKRDPKATYNGNVFSELTIDNIEAYTALDSKFRTAIAKLLQALQKGGTTEGIRLMAEASSSYPVQVIESWNDPTGFARLSSVNETVILVLADTELSEEEKAQLKARIVNNLEMIRPVSALFTVEILDPPGSDNEALAPYAAAGSFLFLSDGSNQYVELLSQEKEIEINSFVVTASPFKVDTTFSTYLGKLSEDGDLDSSLIVEEQVNPESPIFFALLSDGEASEIVLVYNRTVFERDSELFHVYEVSRGKLATSQVDWNSKQNVTIQTNLTKTIETTSLNDESSDIITPIPEADSPDNYPSGKYEGDPTKYDSNGNYLFEWSSQAEYNEWFERQIKTNGGEIVSGGYKMPRVVTLSSGDPLIAALGPSFKVIRPIITPKNNKP